MQVSTKILSEDEDKHSVINEDIYDLPSDFYIRYFIDRRVMKVQTYWCQDESGTYYVLRKSLVSPTSEEKYINNAFEAFACVPVDHKSHKCIVYYFSDFNYGKGNQIILNSYIQDTIKLIRMNILQVLLQ